MKRFAVLVLLLASMSASAATFTVNSNADTDDGTCDATNCTLREAINAANLAPGSTIAFAIGSGAQITDLATVLPTLSAPVTIDATTQPGYAGTPLIVLRGAPVTRGFLVSASNTTIRGFDIAHVGNGIEVDPVNASISNISIERNVIGVRPATEPIQSKGVLLQPSGSGSISDVHIGNGTPSGRNILCGGNGVLLPPLFIGGNTSNVTIAGNYFNLADDGVTTIPVTGFNNQLDIASTGSNIVVGGPNAGDRNVFASGGGIQITVNIQSNAPGIVIEGNYIGTDATGLVARTAAVWGINIGGGNGNGVQILRNVIASSGNGAIDGGSSNNTVVHGNYVGLKADGSGTLSFVATIGIWDFTATNMIIGGTTPADRNYVAGFASNIEVGRSTTVVQGNWVGLSPSGAAIGAGLGNGRPLSPRSMASRP